MIIFDSRFEAFRTFIHFSHGLFLFIELFVISFALQTENSSYFSIAHIFHNEVAIN
jgi:hypothetical protein